jgi:hypothetical protein
MQWCDKLWSQCRSFGGPPDADRRRNQLRLLWMAGSSGRHGSHPEFPARRKRPDSSRGAVEKTAAAAVAQWRRVADQSRARLPKPAALYSASSIEISQW